MLFWKKDQTAGIMESPVSGCIKHEDKKKKQKKQLYNWNFMEQKKTF